MKLHSPNRRKTGVIIVLVLVFLAAMAALISLNSQVLHHFHNEILLLQKRQDHIPQSRSTPPTTTFPGDPSRKAEAP